MSEDISLEKMAAALENLLRSYNEIAEKIEKIVAKLEEFGNNLHGLDKVLALVKQQQETLAPEVKQLREMLEVLRSRSSTQEVEKHTERKTLAAVWGFVIVVASTFGGLIVWVVQRLLSNGHGGKP